MSDDIEIIFAPEGSLGGEDPEALEQRIVSCLKGRVSEAHVFGSVARGDAGYFSDIDLILIKETSQPFHRRSFEFIDLKEIYPDMDILVYTPSEYSKLKEQAVSGFWAGVAKDIRRIL